MPTFLFGRNDLNLTARALLLLLAVTVASTTGVRPAAAQSGPRTAVLQTKASVGVPEGFGDALERVVRARLDALHPVRVAATPDLDLADLQLAVGCVGESDQCLRAVAEQLRVDALLIPNAEQAGDTLVAGITYFDGRPGGTTKHVVRRATGEGADNELLDAVDPMLREVFDLPPPTAAEQAALRAQSHTVRAEAAHASGPGGSGPQATEPTSPVHLVPFVVGGLGVAALVVGAVFGGLSSSNEDAWSTAPTGTGPQVDAALTLRDRARGQATAANIMLGVGAGLIVVGTVLFFLLPRKPREHHDAHPSRVALAPLLGPDERRPAPGRKLRRCVVSRAGRWACSLSALLLLGQAACSVDENANPGKRCTTASDCDTGQICYRSFCVMSDGGTAAQRCDVEGHTRPCYSGPSGTVGVGACKSGMQTCTDGTWAPCLGEITPTTEICNGVDDDCNGNTDEISDTSCDTGMPGACGMGALVCRGTTRVCAGTVDPQPETCNGVDDDCDGTVDEDTDVACYGGSVGCTMSTDGTFTCMGRCKAGVQTCAGGTLGACMGSVQPAAGADGCTASGDTAVDDDCDGMTDEDCPCTNGDTQPCYSGADGTQGTGPCHGGTQTCSGNHWGACAGEVDPSPETCINDGADDDCDGVVDDVPGRGDPCTNAMLQGACRNGMRDCTAGSLTCVTPGMTTETCNGIDDDCNGTIDDGFDLLTDPANCGMCGNACSPGLDCCGGTCTDTTSAMTSCGSCGHMCGSGQDCCGGACVDTGSDAMSCGACGHACGDGQACCGGTCVDTRVDEGNCGGCGTSCASGEMCCGGTCGSPDACSGCTPDCASGRSCCSGSCANLSSDTANCGSCGHACAAGDLCCGGTCVAEGVMNCGACGTVCTTGQLCCGGTCVDDNEAHCGACGTTCAGSDCCCDGTCLDVQTSSADCGACGMSCGTGMICSAGHCCDSGLTYSGGGCCPTGETYCSGTCTNLSSDVNNCGTCGNACGTLHSCTSGTCHLL